MANGEFINVRGESFGEVAFVIGDHELGEEGEWIATASGLSNIVPTEQRKGGEISFEAKVEKKTNLRPRGALVRLATNDRIVARNHDGMEMDVILGENDSKIVVRVIIISARFSSETHACEWTKLG